MLRDKNLVPLSRQHQHALALCVRMERASPIPESDLSAWQAEMVQHFRTEIRIHFEAEERIVFPAARGFAELAPLVDELLSDHDWLRRQFDRAGTQSMSSNEVSEFARRLSEHIRKEERRLFERLQEVMRPQELAAMGRRLDTALKDAAQICVVPPMRGRQQ
jgi:hemerythrin-like domain-containing protein